MALNNPLAKYLEIRDSLLTLLRANVATLNTDLSTGFTITNTTKQITKGNPNFIPQRGTLYPYVFVDVENKDEEYAALGAGGRKRVVGFYTIYALAKKMTSPTDDDDEKVYLARNIEAVLRDNIQFDDNILISTLPSTDFNAIQDGSTNYISGATIILACQMDVI